MEMCITAYSVMGNAVHSTWKSKGNFPTCCKQRFPQLHKQGSYTHSHNADCYDENRPLFLSFIRAKNLKGGITIRNVNTGYMIRAPTSPARHTAARAAPLTTEYRRAADT